MLDDSKVRRFKLARALSALGYDVIASGHDPGALVDDGPCDLLLIEADQAPGAHWRLDDLCRLARAHWRSGVIALLVADASQWPQERAEAAGLDAILRKPVTGEALHAFFEPLLRRRQPEALLDMGVLRDLENLGGRAFVAELIGQFARECEALPQALELAALAGDDDAFCTILHALRSAAGNLGASRIFARCLEWREASKLELAQDGARRIAILRADLAQTLVAMRAFAG